MRELRTRIDEARAVADAMPEIVDALFQLFPGSTLAALLLRNSSGGLTPVAIKSRGTRETLETVNHAVAEHVMAHREPALAYDDGSAAMGAPVLNSLGEPCGVLCVWAPYSAWFSRDALELLAAVASLAALALEKLGYRPTD